MLLILILYNNSKNNNPPSKHQLQNTQYLPYSTATMHTKTSLNRGFYFSFIKFEAGAFMWSRFILTDVSPRGIRYKNTSIR